MKAMWILLRQIGGELRRSPLGRVKSILAHRLKGIGTTLTVLDDEWLSNYGSLEMDFLRIMIPPEKTWFFGTNWRARYVIEFILPRADRIYEDRIERAKTGLFPHDRKITLEIVTAQVACYRTIAWYLKAAGMHV